jgi:DNA-directed RNA polymerase specialized sigma24 family protein
MRALSDAAIIAAMRDGVGAAWLEFDARFRPLLERYAARVGIPRWEWSACITDVLDDEALRLVERSREMPAHLSAYLVRAARNRHLALRRAAARRDHRYASAVGDAPQDDGAVLTLMSAHTRDSCAPPRVAEELQPLPTPMARLAELLSAHVSIDDRQLLAWVAEGVPQRVIGEWLGISREAAKKRVARLCRKLRQTTLQLCAELPPEQRRAIEHVLRRAAQGAGKSHRGESDDG